MAHPCGPGYASVSAIYENCVQALHNIQLGQELQDCQLRLDVIRCRFTRWGDTVKMNIDPRLTEVPPPTGPSYSRGVVDNRNERGTNVARDVFGVLEDLVLLFEMARRTARRHEWPSPSSPRTTPPREGPPAGDQALINAQNHVRSIIASRQHRQLSMARHQEKANSGQKLLSKSTWVLDDRKQFETLFANVTTQLDSLEALLPNENAASKMAEEEVAGIKDQEVLSKLQEATKGTDKVLEASVHHKLQTIIADGVNWAEKIVAEDDAEMQVGHVFARALCTAIIDHTGNYTESMTGKNQAKVLVGNRFT